MYNKTLVLSTLLIALPVLVDAAPVGRQQAQEVARQFMIEKGMTTETTEMAFKAPRHGQVADENAYYYVFNAPGGKGYVVVSGDDRTTSILGYAYKGSFDESRMPQHFKSFLQKYADEIQYLDDANISQMQRAPRRADEQDYEAIAPLMASRWDQGSPYNGLCPSGSPTGCAATSTAQVMYYHKWPAATAAEIPSYVTDTRRFHMDAVPAGTVLNWDDMTDTYNRSSSDESRQAVAELMSYVGRSIKMDYDYMGSGAISQDMPPGISTCFDYQVTQLYRKNYTLVAFEDSIYQQLAAGYPVIFNGMSSGGGHSFVVDGYDSNHYFHINWGWGGEDDDYFLLSVLNPYNNTSIGSSSSSDGFSFDQDAIFLKPGLQTKPEVPSFLMTILGVTDRGVLLEYYSVAEERTSFEFGLGDLVDDDVTPVASTLQKQSFLPYWGEEDMEIGVSGLEAGVHCLVPIYRLEGDSVWNYKTYPYAEVMVGEDGSLEFNTVWNKMKTENYTFENIPFVNQSQPFKVTFRNDTDQEYYGPIYFFANRGEGKSNLRFSSFEGFTVQAHDSLRASFSFKPSTSGAWTVSFASDPNGKCVFGSCTISVDAGDAKIDGIRYKLNPETKEAKVVGGSEEYEGHIVLPDSIVSNNRTFAVTALDANAFYGCTNLLSIVLPAPLTSIGESCFVDCSSLTSVRIPALVKGIGQGAFAGCIQLADIQVDESNAKYSAHDGMLFSDDGKTLNCYPSAKGAIGNLPESLTIVGDGSFALTAITRLVLPESVRRFGSACFEGCEQLTTIVSKARKAPSCLTGSRTGTFAGLDSDGIQLIVPAGAETSYAVADGWRLFPNVCLFKAFGEAGVQGFSSSVDVNLDGIVVVDDGFESVADEVPVSAYKVDYESETGKLLASAVQGIVPAGNGLLVKGQSVLVFPTTREEASADLADNLLVAALADTDLSEIKDAYIYQDGAFVANSSDVVLAGDAYLVLEGAGALSLPLQFEDEPGGISTIRVDASGNVLYDLQGRRVLAPKSGLYILNGRKILR